MWLLYTAQLAQLLILHFKLNIFGQDTHYDAAVIFVVHFTF